MASAIFAGPTQQLDYLQDLGVTAIWLLPFYPSPLKDDGYDIADYYSINPIYGTLRDFKAFLNEAHAAGPAGDHGIGREPYLRPAPVVPTFAARRREPPGAIFMSGATRRRSISEARIIFRDFEPSNWTWDPVARAYLLASVLFPSTGLEF